MAPAPTGAADDIIGPFVAVAQPDVAEGLANYVVTLMTSLSRMKRKGHDVDRPLATARVAGQAITRAFPAWLPLPLARYIGRRTSLYCRDG